MIEIQKFRHIKEKQEIILHTLPGFYECQIDEKDLQISVGSIEKPRESKVTLIEGKQTSDVEPTAKPKVPCVIDTGFPANEKKKKPSIRHGRDR